jgi:hypothetical protein
VVVYLDNILVYSRIETEYIQYIKKVLEKLKSIKLLLKPEKYKFHKLELIFLGFIIRNNSIYIDLAKIKVVFN